MKKIILSILFFTAGHMTVSAQAKDQVAPKESATKQQVNPDGTLAPESKAPVSSEKVVQKKENPSEGTRSAITEKGVPSSKSAPSKQKSAAPSKTVSSDGKSKN